MTPEQVNQLLLLGLGQMRRPERLYLSTTTEVLGPKSY